MANNEPHHPSLEDIYQAAKSLGAQGSLPGLVVYLTEQALHPDVNHKHPEGYLNPALYRHQETLGKLTVLRALRTRVALDIHDGQYPPNAITLLVEQERLVEPPVVLERPSLTLAGEIFSVSEVLQETHNETENNEGPLTTPSQNDTPNRAPKEPYTPSEGYKSVGAIKAKYADLPQDALKDILRQVEHIRKGPYGEFVAEDQVANLVAQWRVQRAEKESRHQQERELRRQRDEEAAAARVPFSPPEGSIRVSQLRETYPDVPFAILTRLVRPLQRHNAGIYGKYLQRDIVDTIVAEWRANHKKQ
jgi:hypothetical protein